MIYLFENPQIAVQSSSLYLQLAMCRQISTHHSQGAWSVRITLPRSVQCGLTPQHAGKARGCHHEVTFVMSEAQNAFEGVYEGGMPVLRTPLCWVRPIWKIADLISSWAGLFFLNSEPTAILLLNRLKYFSTFGQSHCLPKEGTTSYCCDSRRTGDCASFTSPFTLPRPHCSLKI